MTNASNFSFVFFVIRIIRNSLKFLYPASWILYRERSEHCIQDRSRSDHPSLAQRALHPASCILYRERSEHCILYRREAAGIANLMSIKAVEINFYVSQ